ncbi:MAG: YrdB family protein [Umezawaea sp.]
MTDHVGSTPGWNLGLRFVLELAAFAGFAVLGWQLGGDGLLAAELAVLSLLIAATIWGVFAVPGDPSRSGKAPVPVPGVVRLVLELAVFLGGAAAFTVVGQWLVTALFCVALAVHLVFSVPRLTWLVRQPGRGARQEARLEER